MDERNFNNFKYNRINKVNELNERWNDKFLSDLKENRNNRVLFMQNLSTIIAGLIGAGIFFEKIQGPYANISFGFAITTILLITLYLREFLDEELRSGYKLLNKQHKLIDEYKAEIQGLKKTEEYCNLSIDSNKKLDKSESHILDCSGEIINFLFISTLLFLILNLSNISFEYCYVVGVILVALFVSFLPTYHIITYPIRYVVTKIINKNKKPQK